jgi:hypothetical protein
MKRFTKTLLSVAAVSAVSAAMAVSAMAMTATYDPATGKVTLSGIEDTGASQTLLILDKDATTVAEGDIVQIDQKDDGTAFAEVPVGTLTGATYYVRVSGTNGNLQKTTFSATSVQTKEILIGNTNTDTVVDGSDAGQVARFASGGSKTGNAGKEETLADGSGTILIGNTNTDTVVDGSDAGQIARFASGGSKTGNAGKTAVIVVK